MTEYETMRAHMDEIRRQVERGRLREEARRTTPAGATGGSLRQAVGTGLARLGVWMAGPVAARRALGRS